MTSFFINGIELELVGDINTNDPLVIRSVPRPYVVTFRSGASAGERLCEDLLQHANPLLLVDRWVFENYLKQHIDAGAVPTFAVAATESIKSIETVLEIVDFLEKEGASKSSMLFVVGGGIIQDLGAFSAYMYKRGIPWTFVPTTLLSQGDSSVGGKTALNRKKTKNLLALFSAPRHIINDAGFLGTLPYDDWLSGGGEIFRLCITGGEASLREFEKNIGAFIQRDLNATTHLIRVSLAVKKAVVEFDEFELDIRRSMNYGHSFGHAIEALTDYKVVHGAGVALGIIVENEISFRRGILSKLDRDRILNLTNQLLSEEIFKLFRQASMDGILELLKRDKKAEGPILKVATLAQVGRIDFIDLRLDHTGEAEVRDACASVVDALTSLRHV